MSNAVLGKRPICIDSAPLIDIIAELQPITDLLRPILFEPQLEVVLSTVSLAEGLVRPARSGDAGRVAQIHRSLLDIPGVRIVDLDQQHAIETAVVRVQTGLKLPDAAIVATARLAQASVLLGNERAWTTKPLGVPYVRVDDILALP